MLSARPVASVLIGRCRVRLQRILIVLGILALLALVMVTPFRSGPRPAAASGVAAVAAGPQAFLTCAVTTAGGLKCWGHNGDGQLGDGQVCGSGPWGCTTPVDVVGLATGVASVAAGTSHTCALTTAGGVKCWGLNAFGLLGDGTATDRTTPVDVCATGATPPCTPANGNVLTGVAALAAGGFHTCAVTTTGAVKCWGTNGGGLLGDGTAITPTTPVDVCATGATPPCTPGNGNVLTGVVAVAAGGDHTCVLTTAGGAQCWGDNSSGQLGDGTTTQRCGIFTCNNFPMDVVGLTSGVAAVAAGRYHTCALTTAGGVQCWGENVYGQLGDGHDCGSVCTTPVDVVGLGSDVAAVAAGGNHTCALTTAGRVKCWGRNNRGQLGDGTTTDRTTQLDVSGLEGDVAAVAAGGNHTCALTTAGGIQCWGWNNRGQLGDGHDCGSVCTTPVDVVGLGSKPTPTPCPAEGCPTATPTVTPPPTATPPSTPTPAVTATPTPASPPMPTATTAAGLPGDVNCDGTVNSIDAALLLQFGAGLIASLACQDAADVNGDGNINAVDAALILQSDAGLIDSL
jgi:alpha-tubulin suppressor-like RCC1 family protein